jgi:pyridoxal phosphate enzyme (YggS family)
MIAANVERVRARIAAAAARAGRDPAAIVLVAAAKQTTVAMVEEALAAGIADIGENYVQEALAKKAAVQRRARWHMIGHLQRNKAARAVEVFDVVQSVDTIALGASLSRHVPAGRHLSIFVEVNLGGEASKSGVAPAQVPAVVDGLRALDRVHVDGLMAIPPPAAPAAMRAHFRRLRALRDALGLRELSMGMSDDFEAAVEEGATVVRVGRAIFGERKRA